MIVKLLSLFMKRILCAGLCLIVLFMTGCSKSRHIDTASLAETITVEKSGGSKIYTFYLLSGKDKPWGIEIEAGNFEEAKRLAESVYIPNMSLAKLKLMLINEDIADEELFEDVSFAASEAVFSPLCYVSLCDGGVLRQMKERKDLPELIENELILIKNNNRDANIDFLSVFNSFASNQENNFAVTYINSDRELKAEKMNIEKSLYNKNSKK